MSEGTGAPAGGGEAVPGAADAATNTAPTDSAEAQVGELSGDQQFSEEEAPDFGQWKHKLQARNGADAEEVTYAELLSGHMRQKDYTQKTQGLRDERNQHKKVAQQSNALVQRMQKAEGLIEWLHEAGFPIGEALDQFNGRVADEAKLDPREQYELQRQRDTERHQKKEERTQRQMADMRHEQAKESWKAPAHEWTGAALDAVQLPRDREHLGMLIQELQPILQQSQRPVSKDDVMHAATRVDQRLAGYAKRRGLTKAQTTKEPPPSVRPGESYGQAPQAKEAPKQKTMADWNAKMKKLGRGY